MRPVSKREITSRNRAADRNSSEDVRKRIARNQIKATAPVNAEQAALMMPMELYKYPIDIQKGVVAILAACGTPVFVLAVFLHMSEPQVIMNFAHTLANAKSIANSRVAGSLFNTAMYEADPRARTTAAIFWLKAQARWREDGSTTTEGKQEVLDALPLTNLTASQFSRIQSIIDEATSPDFKAANDPQRLLAAEAPPKTGGKKNGKA